jgi:hypothetical protein
VSGRSYAQAEAYAEAQSTHPTPPPGYSSWAGLCQGFTRACLGVEGWAGSAKAAWDAIPAKNRHTGVPRAGSAVYWDNPRGNPDYGHATFAAEHGYIWSTDILRVGFPDKVPWTTITQRWGLPYLGWIDWTPYGGPINLGPINPPPAPPGLPGVHLALLHPGLSNPDVKVYQAHLRAWLGVRAVSLTQINPSGATGFYGTETANMTVRMHQRLAELTGKSGWIMGADLRLPQPALLHELGLRSL